LKILIYARAYLRAQTRERERERERDNYYYSCTRVSGLSGRAHQDYQAHQETQESFSPVAIDLADHVGGASILAASREPVHVGFHVASSRREKMTTLDNAREFPRHDAT
jgi:hypothetical protein